MYAWRDVIYIFAKDTYICFMGISHIAFRYFISKNKAHFFTSHRKLSSFVKLISIYIYTIIESFVLMTSTILLLILKTKLNIYVGIITKKHVKLYC